ncbi:uncharacterized protein LOC120111462 [Phoenix dactylifera]|uniref:Uncharacterized protein LOC120111462 n=1 Tax=Phoenix dactylifera TaxID=42345 RepID=A0A8B9AK88_PHODC|nr:uncharacterized protein LOC120111462 [Phoenix dactylifera]
MIRDFSELIRRLSSRHGLHAWRTIASVYTTESHMFICHGLPTYLITSPSARSNLKHWLRPDWRVRAFGIAASPFLSPLSSPPPPPSPLRLPLADHLCLPVDGDHGYITPPDRPIQLSPGTRSSRLHHPVDAPLLLARRLGFSEPTTGSSPSEVKGNNKGQCKSKGSKHTAGFLSERVQVLIPTPSRLTELKSFMSVHWNHILTTFIYVSCILEREMLNEKLSAEHFHCFVYAYDWMRL